MKKQGAIFFLTFLLVRAFLPGYEIDVNASYDYFRGLPDGSWNGNSGALIGFNGGLGVLDCTTFQAGGSYGIYNWDGRGNVDFRNGKESEQIGFFTAGLAASYCGFQGGLVYDRMFAHRFGIYNLSVSIDQLRFQGGYTFCQEELGLWGTCDLERSHKTADGLHVSFKTISQLNLFWTHYFQNCAKTTLWIGTPYRNSLRYHHKLPSYFIAGFSFRAPLTENLALEGNGSYMPARKAHGVSQSRNYGSSICIGLTYAFSNRCSSCDVPYMSIANHSNFFVDTNVNQ